ncbi:hypothetical protein [Sphingomonas sp. RB1R13]|uniref:hypothetical protein n=1 Tax=Sphingomonas sp. RB1R13 TaxID=3096159 RepID=UPI002FCAED70
MPDERIGGSGTIFQVRIGFLYNHDQLHQVAHSLPIALALAAMGTGAEIVLITTSERIRGEVERLAGDTLGHGAAVVSLGLKGWFTRLAERVAGRLIPVRKLAILSDNVDFFRTLDVLVVAEKTSLALKRRFGLDRLKIVHTRHGAGDRAIGFDKASAGFDAVLVSGPKIGERLVREAGVSPDRLYQVGYPKFDLHRDTRIELPLAKDGRPVVLYNPHPSPHLSSWFSMGPAILDWFVANPDYQLIFAPHVMLFERPVAISIDKLRVARPGRIEQRWREAPNIVIDTGSRASTTMAYTNAADIYVGDASSQLYEFLLRPRPCLFVDAHHTKWQGNPNYAHWQAGPVISDVANLGEGLAESRLDFETVYRPIQQRLFAHSFDLTDEPSAIRAAWAIATIAGLTP